MKTPRETREGIWFVGKEKPDKTGANIYLNTNDTMGTYGEPEDSFNHLGCIYMGRIDNPHGISAINYFLKEDWVREEIKQNIRQVLKMIVDIEESEVK